MHAGFGPIRRPLARLPPAYSAAPRHWEYDAPMTPATDSPIEDEGLTALARLHDRTARVIVIAETWWLVDELGKVALGSNRISAARDLAHYLELLEAMLQL